MLSLSAICKARRTVVCTGADRAGAGVPVYQAILGLAYVAVGTWAGSRSVRAPTVGRFKPEMTMTGARAGKWQLLGSALACLALGVLFISNSLQDVVARWLLGILGAGLLIWIVSSDLASWRRSRQQRRPKAVANMITVPLTEVSDGPGRSPTDSWNVRSEALRQLIAQIPKLTVRVRFPSPAPSNERPAQRPS